LDQDKLHNPFQTVAQLGNPVLWSKKYFCVSLPSTKTIVLEVKNRCKNAEEAKAT